MAFSLCFERVRLTPADVAQYATIPGAHYQVPEEQPCELELGHGDVHAAEVQFYPDDLTRSYWVTWRDGQPYKISLLPECTVQPGDLDAHGDATECVLYDGHGGGHDWTA